MCPKESILDRLSEHAGVDKQAAIEVRRHLLTSLGYPAMTDEEAEESLNNAINESYMRPLPTFRVIRKNGWNDIIISLPSSLKAKELSWHLIEEDGRQDKGKIALSELKTVETASINGIDMEKKKLFLPFEPKHYGYHRLVISINDIKSDTLLIFTPEKCYFPPSIENGERTWGVPTQMYALRSETNQGIGDFTDLGKFGEVLSRNGVGILGITPIHSMFNDKPHEASPYSPASRTFFNYIYLDVTAVPDFAFSEEAFRFFHDPEQQEKIRKLRNFDYVDYTSVLEFKTTILRKLFDSFKENELGDDEDGYLTERGRQFRIFCEEGGGPLERFVAFQALSMKFKGQCGWWKEWPAEFQNPNNEAVKEFIKKNKSTIDFYKYLQWETERQLGQASKSCINGGMAIGLYMDLAVGVSHASAEVWAEHDLYAENVAAGTPPDILSEVGVDWGVAAMKPKALRDNCFKPFINMLRKNMKHSGCLRLDHVLQLSRLYLITHNLEGNKGAFVNYPADELMSIVALESHRNMCMVIGEDLGHLPEGFREKLEDYRILSFRVLPFEKENKTWTKYLEPQDYPKYAVAASSTHDTPTLASQWTLHHNHEKEFLGFFANEEQRDEAFRLGAENRAELNYVLTKANAWEEVGSSPSEDPYNTAAYCPENFERAVAVFLAWTPCIVMLMPLCDIFLIDKMSNIPGTTEEHKSISRSAPRKQDSPNPISRPNWRLKDPFPIEVLDRLPQFRAVSSILNAERPSGKNQHLIKNQNILS